jgi:uncharacterized membrane protein
MDRLAAARVLSPAAIVAGVAILVLAAARGEARLYLVLVFPVVTGEGAVFALGTLLLLVGIVAAFLSWAPMMVAPSDGPRTPGPAPPQAPEQAPPPSPPAPAGPPGEVGTRWGGVVFVGPVPIVFGSSPRTTALMLAAAVVMGLLVLVFVLGALIR